MERKGKEWSLRGREVEKAKSTQDAFIHECRPEAHSYRSCDCQPNDFEEGTFALING
jgi:hypothetical protein